MARTVSYRRTVLCRGGGPQPPYADLATMLDGIEAELGLCGGAPFAVTAESWRAGPGRFLARIVVEVDPAAAAQQSLRAWFQWQHVRWQWSWAPPPPPRAPAAACEAAP